MIPNAGLPEIPRFIRFGLIGATSTVLSLIVFNIVYRTTHIVPAAVVVSFLAGAVNGSYWHRKWTFSDRRGESGKRQAMKFTGVSTISCLITTLVSTAVLTQWPIGIPAHSSPSWHLYWSIALGKAAPHYGSVAVTAAALAGGIVSMGWSYGASHFWAFKKN